MKYVEVFAVGIAAGAVLYHLFAGALVADLRSLAARAESAAKSIEQSAAAAAKKL